MDFPGAVFIATALFICSVCSAVRLCLKFVTMVRIASDVSAIRAATIRAATSLPPGTSTRTSTSTVSNY